MMHLLRFTKCITQKMYIGSVLLAAFIALSFTSHVSAFDMDISNPEWEIVISDFGYSDETLDKRPGFVGRDYLSGEWGAAIGYKVGGAPVTTPVWFEPNFAWPDWTTNSDFVIVNPIASTSTFNSDGFEIFESKIMNSDFEITIVNQMLDTQTGIEQGTAPKSDGGAGSSKTSTRYVFKQSYDIANISGETITDINFFQFLHSLEGEEAIYDDRDYGGTFGEYHYDITEIGESIFEGYLHKDYITLNAAVAPLDWEVGYYGIEGIDNHEAEDGEIWKPGTGVHLSVEGDILSGLDYFNPAELWVSGALKFGLGSLGAGSTTSFDVILSIQTVSTPVPEPATFLLLALGLAGLAGAEVRRRRKKAIRINHYDLGTSHGESCMLQRGD